MCAGPIGAGTVALAAPRSVTAAARPAVNNRFHVVNAPSTIAFRSSPDWNYPTSGGFVNGDTIGLDCYEFGGPVGPYGNTLWYDAVDNADGYTGWINDHYLSTPGTAASPQPQTAECLPSGYGGQFASGPTYQVIGAASSQYFDNSPKSSDNNGSSGYYDNGDSVQLFCYEFGNPTGPYGNQLWYLAHDAARGTYGWVNDHYLNTPDTAAHPVPETSRPCGSCYGSSCTGENPMIGCDDLSYVSTPLSHSYTGKGNVKFTLQIRYSSTCHAAWGRMYATAPSSAAPDFGFTAWNPGQPSQGVVGGSRAEPQNLWTGMITASAQDCAGTQYYLNGNWVKWYFLGCWSGAGS